MIGNERLAEAVSEAYKPRPQRKIKTHCHKGHEMTPENTRTAMRGGVLRHDCLRCDREYKRARAERARDARNQIAIKAARLEEIEQMRHDTNLAGLNSFMARRRKRGVPEEGVYVA